MITDAVKNKLTQFNIPEERYATEYSELSSRGYSEQQIHHLVLRKSSAVTINKLIFLPMQFTDLTTTYSV